MLKLRIQLIMLYFKKDFKKWYRDKSSISNDLISIMTSGMVYALIALEYSSENLFFSQFIIIGSIFNYIFISTVIASYTAISESYWNKKLELLIASSFPIELYCLSISISRYIRSVIYGIIILLFSVVLFRIKLILTFSNSVLLIFLLIMVFFGAIGVGFLSASTFLALNAKAGDDPVQYFLLTFGSLVTGVYIPLKLFPETIQTISLIFPQTLYYKMLRRLFLPVSDLIAFNNGDLSMFFFFLISQTFAWFFLGRKFLLHSISHAKKRGDLVLWT